MSDTRKTANGGFPTPESSQLTEAENVYTSCTRSQVDTPMTIKTKYGPPSEKVRPVIEKMHKCTCVAMVEISAM